MKYRRCVGCGQRKSADNFRQDRRSVGGYSRFCDYCRKNGWPEIEDSFPKFEGVRKCRECGTMKKSFEFGWRDKRKRYVHSTCKSCMNKNVKKRYNRKRKYHKSIANRKYYIKNKMRKSRHHKPNKILKILPSGNFRTTVPFVPATEEKPQLRKTGFLKQTKFD